MHSKVVVAHHPYTAARDDELSFVKGDVIKVTDDSDPDWWVGKKQDGSVGYFPSNFVDVRQDNEEIATATRHPPPPVAVPSETSNTQTEEEEEEVPQQQQALSPPLPTEPAPAPPVTEEEERLNKQPVENRMNVAPVKEDALNEDEETKEQSIENKADRVVAMARVMEDYAMQEPGEISLSRGGIVNVYETLDHEWSRGELNGRVGRFPTKYVEEIDMPGRPDMGRLPSNGSGDIDAPKAAEEESPSAPKGGFKLAAFGVKQGGIGSLLAGGFPALKKTKPVEEKKDNPVSSSPPAPAPPVHANASPTASQKEPKRSSVLDKPVSAVPAVPAFTATESNPSSPTTRPEPTEKKEASLGKAIVLHPYDAVNDDELNLLRGEYVEVLNRHADEGWWQGRNEKGEVGIFPSNFVKELEEDHFSPPTPIRSRPSATSSIHSNLGSSSLDNTAPSAPAPTASMAKPPPVPRPTSMQSSLSSSRPVSIDRPTSYSSIPTEKQMEDAIKEEEQYEADEEKPNSPMRSEVDSPAFTPVMGEREIPAHPPPTSNPPNLIERTPSETSQDKFPPVIPEEPISDDEVKESGVDDFVNAQEEDEFFDVHDDTTTTAAAAAAAAAVPPMTVADTLMARMSPIKVEFDVNNSSSLDSLAENGIPASPLVALENKEKGMSLSGAKELEEPEKLQERESVDPASISSDVRDLESKDKSIEDLIPEVKDNKVPSESPLETSLAEKDEKKPLLTADNDDDNAVVRDKPKDSDHLSDSHSVKPIIETPGLTEAMAERSLGAHHESGALDEAASEKPSDTPLVQEMPDKKHTDNVSVTEPLEKEEDLEGKKPFDEEEKSMAPKVTEPEGKADGAPDIVDSASLDNEKTPLKEEAEEKPTTKPFDSIPTSGPRLTSPSRVRPASARRSPLLTKESQEPSQMELLKKELDADASQEKEEEKKQSVPEEEETSSAAVEQPAAKPAKPIKPIFAKFPTPFAVSGSQEELIKRNLRPTSGGRRLWEPTAQNTNSNNSSSSPEEPDHDHKENESPSPRPMGGVKSIASRFNFNNNNGGSSNEVLETKLKNYTKHEVEKLRKELLEERDKRMQLEEKVEALSARLNALLEQ